MKWWDLPAWRNASLRLKGLVVLALPAVALVGAALAGWGVTQQAEQAESAAESALRVRSEVDAVLSLLQNAETGMREYLLTGREEYLQPYLRARAALSGAGFNLPSGAGSDDQAAYRRQWAPLIGQELDLLARERASVPAPAAPGGLSAATKQLLDESTSAMERLSAAWGRMELVEDRRVQERLAQARARRRHFVRVVAFGSLLGPLGGIVGGWLLATAVGRRIRRLEQNAQLLADGKPLPPSSPGEDEISRLGRKLEEAAGLLRLRNQELQESESRFRLLFEGAPVAYHEIDQEGIIRRVNDAECRLLGYTREELLGRPVWDLVMPEQQDLSRAAVGRKLRGEQVAVPFERQYIQKDGSIISLEIYENPIVDERGRVVGMHSALLDVSERKVGELAGRKVEQYAQRLRVKNEQLARALATAREATETKNRFLASMSHELRTPLNGIIGFSELMYDGKVGPVSEAHQEFLGDILTSARHLLHLINDILDLAKVESGRMDFRPEHVNLNALVEEVRDILRPLADKKQLPIEFEPATGLSDVMADASRFKQVLYNYLSNAVKFTPANGRITVRLVPESTSEFRVEVEDTGVGIGADESPRLFQDFHQLASGRRQEQGTGLGLALTKRIVEAQGGRVGLRSSPGQGSTFYAILPRALSNASIPVVATPAEPPIEPAPRPTRVLVIEDDPKDSDWLSQVLTAAGYSVETSASSREALAKCQEQPFDAVILDLLLPDRGGWDLLRAIRSSVRNSRTPVIVVSLGAEKESGAAFQIEDFLSKPLEAAELVHSLERAGVPPYGSQTVLVVDDDPNTLKVMQTKLIGFGYRALCAADGESGLRMAIAERPAAIILDLIMPVMDGFQFLERFRGDPAARRTPVLVWTNKDLTTLEYAQLEGLAQNVVLKRDGNASSILEQLSQYLPAPLAAGHHT